MHLLKKWTSKRWERTLPNAWISAAGIWLASGGIAAAADPPGDQLEAPDMIGQPYGSLIVDSAVTATSQPGEPLTGTGNTVWFRWTAPAGGPVAFDTMSGFF